jgi:hypothetical protein
MNRISIDGKVYRLAALEDVEEVPISEATPDSFIAWIPEDRFGVMHPGAPIVEVGDP